MTGKNKQQMEREMSAEANGGHRSRALHHQHSSASPVGRRDIWGNSGNNGTGKSQLLQMQKGYSQYSNADQYGATDASGNLKQNKGRRRNNEGARKNSRETSVVTNIKLSRGFHERKNASGEK